MSDKSCQMDKRHQYMVIESEIRDGETIVSLRVSKRHPDKPCICEQEGFDGEDIHDDIRMRFKVGFLRLTDQAGLLESEAGQGLVAFAAGKPEAAA